MIGDEDAFAQYLASSCDRSGNPLAAVAALRNLLPEGQIEVQLPTVQVDYRDPDHVTVNALPDMKILVDGEELPESTAVAIVGPKLDFVREGGSWRLESCDLGR